MTERTKKETLLTVIAPGDPDGTRPAIIAGEYVRIHVDCRENFGNPAPLAYKIVKAVNAHDALINAVRLSRKALYLDRPLDYELDEARLAIDSALKLAGEDA